MTAGSWLFFWGALLLVCACDAAEPGSCESFADREMGITGEEYRPCAAEILAALDSLEPHLEALVEGDAESREAARKAYTELRRVIGQTGIEDDYRSFRPGTVTIKWPDREVSAFNSSAFAAMVQYMAVLAHPNEDNFGQGVRAHEEARRYYQRIR